MYAFDRPFNRRVVVGIVAVLTVVLTAILLLPVGALARVDEPQRAARHPQQAGPPLPSPPPPLNPPIATPEPDAAGASAGAQTGSSDVEAVKFRPQVRLVRGQAAVSSQGVDKPESDRSTDLEKPSAEGPLGPQEAYTSPNYDELLGPLDWGIELYEDFEGAFPGDWILEDFSDDGYERLWGDTSYWSQYGFWSAWPAARGAHAVNPADGYVDNLNSWMEYGPFDFSNMADVFVSFGLWYDTEPEFDWVYFCASIDFVNYDCDYWSGYSGVDWTDQAFWLTSYAGYSQVWLAWVFESDFSISGDLGYAGPFVDEIVVWGYDLSTAPTPTPTPDPGGQLIVNGSFETGDLFAWTGTDGVGVADTTYVDGQWSAFLWQEDGTGDDFLHQTFYVPAGVTDVVLNYWFAVTTDETLLGRDFFCASLRPPDLGAILVDFGCIDSLDATGEWQEVVYTLTSSEVAQVEGQTVALTFEMYNHGAAETWSAGWVDYVRLYATGGGAGGHIDPNEPNDEAGDATPITCEETISGTIGDALGGYDVDWFRLSGVPEGRIDIDIFADTQVPPSALDSVVNLWDDSLPNPNWLAWSDDDGVSYDSYLVYTNTVPGANFYISVESYWGYGSPDSFYDLEVQCEGMGSGPPEGGEELPEDGDAWTVMLFLNAEDPGFESLLTGYRNDIEAFIDDKDAFLNVAILYDGSGDGDTTRYLVQPDGNYTLGTNQWHMGELNMGHPDTLANFVTWAMDQYPAENYYLAVDDHGNGVYGISYDSTSNDDQLTPPELYSALKGATHNGARKIDILDYEACLMGLAENAYDVRQWVDYVVFSEQISWGIDTYPRYFSDLAATDEPEDVGRRIVDRYHGEALVTNNGYGYPHTISLIDTSQVGNVSDAVSNFGDAIRATDTQVQKDAINDARDDSQAFAADYDATNSARAEYIDLWDLADEASDDSLASAQAAAVKSAVDAAVVHERHASGGASGYVWDHSGAHGLAIYYPPSKSSGAFDSYVAPSLYQMSHDGTWDEFLAWAVPSRNRRGMSASRTQDKLAGDDAFAWKDVYLPVVMKAVQ